ncbi:nucleotide exchange factor GrpE [Nitrospina watsonii]|uniref:Protein GrpE n=1 Tax=Nitrospina watsonii TaxID=1323948 RepID=A0ABN8W565_9BACT|nr:nucleotide exchange factor GrpE [Nitrospina watsonii]CAI2718781.1 Protein GrpE [Nitrospina watsonii]
MSKKSDTYEQSEDEKKSAADENVEEEELAEAQEPDVVSEDDIETLLKKKDDEVAEMRNEMLRLRADVENVRRRLNKEKQDAIVFANQRLIKALIPVFDNLDRALKAPDTNVESLKEGVRMTAKQFEAVLDKENVEPIIAVGEKFDPEVHEVLAQIESHEHAENTVVEEYVRGYKMNGRMVLPAKVAIAKKPSGDKPADPAA